MQLAELGARLSGFQIQQHLTKGGNYRVKLLKLLIVPAVLLFSVVMAAPAFAHNASITGLTASCDQTGKICVDFNVTTTGFDDNGRDILLNLRGRKPNTSDFVDTGVIPVRVHLTKNLHDKNFHLCFPGAPPTGFDQFKVKITVPPDVLDSQGNPIKDNEGKPIKNDLELDEDSTLTSEAFSASTCVAQTPPTPQTPTPTSSAAAATTLAGTGGFDFRYPLVGLTALVAGLALLLVSASRGRSSTK